MLYDQMMVLYFRTYRQMNQVATASGLDWTWEASVTIRDTYDFHKGFNRLMKYRKYRIKYECQQSIKKR